MGSFSHLIVLVLVTAVVHVSATRFCSCENPTYDRRFSGINAVCGDLGPDWCKTNCGAFGVDCDYCQFKPAGTGSDEAYDRLKTWCYSQTGYDFKSQKSYKGTSVECYGAKGAIPQSWFDFFGCRHEDNGDDDPSQPAPANPDQATKRKAPMGATVVNFFLVGNIKRTGRHCNHIYPSAANKIKDQFLENHKDCSVDSNRFPPPGVNYLRCPYFTEGRLAAYEKDLDNLCDTIGGGEKSDDIPLVD